MTAERLGDRKALRDAIDSFRRRANAEPAAMDEMRRQVFELVAGERPYGGRRQLYMTQNGPRVIYIPADLFISPRVFSFRRPVRCGVCREFQAFDARRFAAARKKGAFQSL